MIEIICNDAEATEKEKNTNHYAMKMPKNVKQIGDISSNRKIYIEDYAFSYIHSLAYGTLEDEQAGVLLGECQKMGKEKCLFIKGVIKARCVDEDGRQGIYFNELVWNGIYADIEKYFPNLEVVGWFAALPSVTTERMEYVKHLHLDNFAGNMKTMYLINKSEKEENFYLYENGDLRKQNGYVCFYERNYEMQEYMLQKRGHRSVEVPETDKVVKSIRTILQEKEENRQQKRNIVFMYGISSFMVVVILVIGINLMNSYEKMRNLDTSIHNIAVQMSNITDDSQDTAVVSGNVVSVHKLAGDVYPTQEQTQNTVPALEETAGNLTTAAQTQAVIETPVQEMTSQNTQLATQPESKELPSQTVQESTEKEYETYTVKEGDTVMSISKKYYGTVKRYEDIAKLNDLNDMDQLYVGQQIKLP